MGWLEGGEEMRPFCLPRRFWAGNGEDRVKSTAGRIAKNRPKLPEAARWTLKGYGCMVRATEYHGDAEFIEAAESYLKGGLKARRKAR